MKDITPLRARNAETQEIIDEMHNWIERHITDETDGFALVSVSVNEGAAVIEHKSTCGGDLPRAYFAGLCYGAVLGRADPDIIDHGNSEPKFYLSDPSA